MQQDVSRTRIGREADARPSGGRADAELRAIRARVAAAALIGLGVLAFWLLKDSGAW